MVGSHLADYILEHQPGHEIYGLARWRSPTDNVRHLGSRVYYVRADLRDLASFIAVPVSLSCFMFFPVAGKL